MAERPPATATDVVPAATEEDPPAPLRPPPGAFLHRTDDGTYVVHFPKDQVYRVPPPENAALAERYRNLLARGGKGDGGPWFRSRVFVRIMCLTGSVAIALLVLYISFLLVSPQNPEFAITRVLAKGKREFEVTVRATNPNARIGVYEGGGEMVLLFKGKRILTGRFPGFFQGGKKSTTVRAAVFATGKAMPREIERSLSKHAAAVSMGLTADVPVRMKIGALTTWRMEMRVTCEFRVSSLGKDGRVTSQQCHTKVTA